MLLFSIYPSLHGNASDLSSGCALCAALARAAASLPKLCPVHLLQLRKA
jgi:hypothetical protein